MKADIFKLKHPLISPALLRHYWELVQCDSVSAGVKTANYTHLPIY